MNQFEYNLARFCAPALVGVKTSNLICCINSQYKNLEYEINKASKELAAFDLQLFELTKNEDRTMLLVFNTKELEKQLNKAEIKNFLSQFGYDCTNILQMLNFLKEKINFENQFPHEIGVFLGYPLEDVIDFIENKKTCKLIGNWKVYNNVETAKEKFNKYKLVTNDICNKLKNNIELVEILKEYKGEKC